MHVAGTKVKKDMPTFVANSFSLGFGLRFVLAITDPYLVLRVHQDRLGHPDLLVLLVLVFRLVGLQPHLVLLVLLFRLVDLQVLLKMEIFSEPVS